MGVAAAFAAAMAPVFWSSFAAKTPANQADLFGEWKWRAIGPYRGGRTKAVTGVRGRPGLVYIGVVNGGVWKTTDYGRTWTPIFDDQATASIGDIAVAPSNPDVIYVTSGEGLHRPDLSVGNGVYKSTDGGRTWTHLGLDDGQQIPRVIVDPKNPDRVFVAVLGHPYGPNAERGVYRSTDGGATFKRVLFKDENTGASELEFDPSDANVVYAGLWEAREGPWENAAWPGSGGGIFKSTDGGDTWTPLTTGLPAENVQADLAIAPSDPKRIYASVATGQPTAIYRSDDGGASWTRATEDNRPAARIGGGDLPVLSVDPKNPDVVYSASVVTWKSTDGGRTWTGIRGAPGGDDYQRLWIDPDNPDVIAAASDQGAVITVNGGRTWSSWYTQPTAQLYHVAADNAFPYRLCSGQQESGSACVASRGNDGQITFREWHPAGVDEYGYAAPDPLDPDVVFGGRQVTRFDRRTGQVQTVGPTAGGRGGGFRVVRTQPVLFSNADPHLLFYANNVVWKTANGGATWQQVSPDLTRKTWDVPANVGKYASAETARPTQRGVVYTVAPSPIAVNVIWAGTDDGLIHVTTDGGLHWNDVTPPEQRPWAKVSLIDAGHFDGRTAYAAINTLRLDDLRPRIYRTHDGGRTWTVITNGIPPNENTNAVREDPKKRGVLYAATERGVYVSFDDGERWQSLRLNLPATSVRDLIVKDDDLAIATHGRGFWILDDVTALRQIDAIDRADAHVFAPAPAYRVRYNMNTDTPLPADESAGPNPPDGAVLDYWLKRDAAGPVTLEILDAAGTLVRRYSSDDRPAVDPNPPVPAYWYRPPQTLSSAAGLHRFVWDLRYTPLSGGGGRGGLPIAATPHDTVPPPASPWAVAGTYTVKLTAAGRSVTQPLTVRMDPRVKTPPAALAQQFTLSKRLYDAARTLQDADESLRRIRAGVRTLQPRAQGDTALALAEFDKEAAALGGAPAGGGGRGRGGPGGGGGGGRGVTGVGPLLPSASAEATQVMTLLQAADRAPTSQVLSAVTAAEKSIADAQAKWTALKADLTKLNARLKAAGLDEITAR